MPLRTEWPGHSHRVTVHRRHGQPVRGASHTFLGHLLHHRRDDREGWPGARTRHLSRLAARIPAAAGQCGAAGGKLYVATPASDTVEAITLSTSSAAIVAGRPGSTGSPTIGPATTSELNEPSVVAADATALNIGDIHNNEVEKVTPHGTLSVFAGTGTPGRVQTPGTTPVNGYRLAAADGGVFAFRKAQFYGSEGGKHLNAPDVGAT